MRMRVVAEKSTVDVIPVNNNVLGAHLTRSWVVLDFFKYPK